MLAVLLHKTVYGPAFLLSRTMGSLNKSTHTHTHTICSYQYTIGDGILVHSMVEWVHGSYAVWRYFKCAQHIPDNHYTLQNNRKP